MLLCHEKPLAWAISEPWRNGLPRISVVIGKSGHSSFEACHGWGAHRFDEHVLPFAFCLC